MSEHLSALQLDEVVAGLSPAPPHLAGCEACAAQLQALQAQSAAFLAQPQARRQMDALAPLRPQRSYARVVALLAPLAAGLLLFLAWPRIAPEDRIKGAVSVVLLNAAGQPVSHAAPGDRLTLAVGTAGFPRVTVYSVDAQGTREPLWSGPVDAGARVPLMQLEVTPGAVTVTAEFEGAGQPQRASVELAVP